MHLVLSCRVRCNYPVGSRVVRLRKGYHVHPRWTKGPELIQITHPAEIKKPS